MERSTPFSAASLRARGDAFILPSVSVATGAGVATGAATGTAGVSSTSTAGAGAAGAAGSSAGAATSPPFNASMSSPSSPRMANTVSTGAVSPSPVPIYRSLPSCPGKASNSIVALSVSISANKSPSLTESPICLCHFATTPSVMVSESLGILITIAI